MPGLVQGLETARRALLAHQAALTVTGNNLANVATEGYSRQSAILQPTPPEPTPDGYIGTGVRLEEVRRARDGFLDLQIRNELGLQGKWAGRSETLAQLENILNEPSDMGLSQAMDDFWNAWLDLSNQPDDPAARAVVVRSGEALAQGLRQLHARTQAIIENTDADLEQRVRHLNGLCNELAVLNSQIARSEVAGSIESALRDRRDLILDELARDGGATMIVRADEMAVVRLGGRTVVEGSTAIPMEIQRYNDDGHVRVRVAFASDLTAPEFNTGTLAGLLEVRDTILPGFLEEMDQMTAAVVEQVNRLHRAGPSHLDFFRGQTVAELEVNPENANVLTQVNPGTTGEPGDNDIALAMAALRDARVMDRGTSTIGDFYRRAVADIGSLSQQAANLSDSQTTAVETLEGRRQAVMGVNLDEELTRMMTTQKAYEAAARVFSVASEMLDVLLAL